jgi:hypothetical protein
LRIKKSLIHLQLLNRKQLFKFIYHEQT